MKTIFKQKLDICDKQTIELPQDFKILHINEQNGVPCIWYKCTSDAPAVKLDIYCFGTGFRMDGLPSMQYIGTVMIDGYVWHFYTAPVPIVGTCGDGDKLFTSENEAAMTTIKIQPPANPPRMAISLDRQDAQLVTEALALLRCQTYKDIHQKDLTDSQLFNLGEKIGAIDRIKFIINASLPKGYE